MATVKKNIVTQGLSGKLGNNIVFRNRGGKTIVAVTPEKKKRVYTEAQRKQTRKFRSAIVYGKQAIQDPTTKAVYEAQAKDGQSAFNIAVADYLNAPSIEELELGTYQGTKGSQFILPVVDDHQVTEVSVAMYNQAGALVEEGSAQQHENGVDWVYTTQKQNAKVKGSKLIIRASDLPGNTVEKEIVLN